MADSDHTPVTDDGTDDTTAAEETAAGDEITAAIAALGPIEAEALTDGPSDASVGEDADEPSADTTGTPATIDDSAPDAVLAEAVGGGLTWIPFALYLGAWVLLVGATTYLLWGATPEEPARWHPAYMPLVWTGVGLTAVGPVVSLAVWLVARSRRPKAARQGLFASAMTRGALAAFFGVLLWVAALYALDLSVMTGGL